MQIDDSGQSDDLDAVLKIISGLARKSATGNYIYRGEPKCFPRVSSSLYRQYDEIQSETFDIEAVQKEILREAAKFIPESISSEESNSLEVLTQLQHYGGKTNLIDFTNDCLIALFFACDGFPDKEGRVVLVNKTGPMRLYIKDAPSVSNRVVSQKSIFVQPPQGFVQQYEKIIIPSRLKKPLLEYLRNAHNISIESIYNDIFGFIKYRNVHRSAYTEFYRGLTRQNRNEDKKAIAHYSESIGLNSQSDTTYNNRGVAYKETGRVELAIRDFNRAIELNPRNAGALYNRGELWLSLAKWERAESDLTAARDNGMDIVSQFRSDNESISHFEQKYGVEIPEDIAEMFGG